MELASIVGLCAAALTTISFLPQVVKTWRTRHTKDLSLIMYLCFCTGVALWLVYGILRSDLPVTLANSVTLALALIILALKLKHG